MAGQKRLSASVGHRRCRRGRGTSVGSDEVLSPEGDTPVDQLSVEEAGLLLVLTDAVVHADPTVKVDNRHTLLVYSKHTARYYLQNKSRVL